MSHLGKSDVVNKIRKVNEMKKELNHDKESSKTVEQGKSNKLSEEQKKELQVKDGQNNHQVDERGGN